MDHETAERVVNGILYSIDQAPELDDAAAGDCAAAIVEGKLFVNSPAEFDEALGIVTAAGRLPESSLRFSRRFGEQQLLTFLRAVAAELSRRLADPDLATAPTGMSVSMADGLVTGILIDADRFGDLTSADAARQCAEEIFTPARYSHEPAQYVEAIGAVLGHGRLGERTRELSAVSDDAVALQFLRALRDELQRRLENEPGS